MAAEPVRDRLSSPIRGEYRKTGAKEKELLAGSQLRILGESIPSARLQKFGQRTTLDTTLEQDKSVQSYTETRNPI